MTAPLSIQNAFANCCDGIKEFASSVSRWMGRTAAATGAFLSDTAAKVAEFVKPHFEQIKTFAQENRESIIVAAVAFTVGAIATAIITQVFCRGTNSPVSTTAATV